MSLRARWSSRWKFWLGFAWCPLVVWAALAAQMFLVIRINQTRPQMLDHWPPLVGWSLLFSWLACSACGALFCGFGAAFFWREVRPFPGQESGFVFWSMALAWAPSLVLGCAAVVLLVPFFCL